ncbi:MAG: site-2 protease family protein [Myxococcota bacterium]|nr:site-2 protease family protein [Myxococcota bacterium]
MARWSFNIGSAFGIPIRAHATLLLVLGILAALFGSEGGDAAGWLEAGLFVVILFGSVLVHELGHALVARRCGVETREIILLPIGGVAILADQPRRPFDELIIAIAGPLTSLVLALIGMILATITESEIFHFLFVLNMVLGLFNMLPAFPMDGGRVLRAMMSMRMGFDRGTRVAAIIGRVMAVGLIIAGLYLDHAALALVGAFVYFAAGSEERQVRIRSRVDGHIAMDLMEPAHHIFGATTAPDDVVEAARREGAARAFAVTFGDQVLGVVHAQPLLEAIAMGDRPTLLHSILDRNVVTTRPTAPIREVLMMLGQTGSRAAVVLDEAGVQGLLHTDSLVRFLNGQEPAHGPESPPSESA